MSELISIDYEILNFILKNGNPTADEILDKFPDRKFNTNHRLSMLKEKEYDHIGENCKISKEGSNYIDEISRTINIYGEEGKLESSRYYLTDLGKTIIINYKVIKVEERKKFWIEKIIFSIIVPCIIAYITTYFSK